MVAQAIGTVNQDQAVPPIPILLTLSKHCRETAIIEAVAISSDDTLDVVIADITYQVMHLLELALYSIQLFSELLVAVLDLILCLKFFILLLCSLYFI